MEGLHYQRAKMDHGLLLHVVGGSLLFGLAVHVDDSLNGGVDAEVARFESAIAQSISVGPVSCDTLTFKGLRLRTESEEASAVTIRVDKNHFISSIEEVPINPARASAKDASISTHGLTLYRRSKGAFLCASGQTQPFLAYSSSLLARRFHQAVGNDLLVVNRAVRAAQTSQDLPLRFFPIHPPHRIVLFSNASSISNASPTAQTGYLVFLAADTGGRGALGPSTPLVLLAWDSHSQRLVTHSSFAAETYALIDGMRAAVDVACVFANISDGDDSALAHIDTFIDCHSLFNTIPSTGLVKTKEVYAGVAAFREMYEAGAMSSLTWLPAAGQLADCLTKPSSSNSLLEDLRTGRYGLVPAGSLTKIHTTEQAEPLQEDLPFLPTLLLSDCGAEIGSILLSGCLN